MEKENNVATPNVSDVNKLICQITVVHPLMPQVHVAALNQSTPIHI